jgi:hypothetical protein
MDVQDMQEKVPIKLDAAASRKIRNQDHGYQRILRNINGYEIWISVDKKGCIAG